MAEGFVFSAGAGGAHVSGKEPPDGGGNVPNDKEQKTRVSFRDMVMGRTKSPIGRPKVDLFKENLARIEYENGNMLKPMVHIADAVFDGLCEPWKDALVVKLLGKSICYKTMKERLERLWKLSADFDMMDIGNDIYMIKFSLEGDCMKVMDKGPWMIFDHYLTVQTWTSDFISPTVKIDKTMVAFN